jgi:hypothetical protein
LKSADTPLAITTHADGVGFTIHVTPGARIERVGPIHGDALRVAVSAPAVDGRANAACVVALAAALEVARDAVRLDPGSRGRRKRVRVDGEPRDLTRRLGALASTEGLR